MTNLDPEEQEILEAFETDRLKRSANCQDEIAQHQKIAAATFTQSQVISIPVSTKDLRSLQKRALAEGIPYSIYVSSILHKFLEGKLVEVPSNHESS